jgi:glyoxylate reductase
MRAGRFHGWRVDLLLGRPVYGKTLGIIGLGRIGRAVARRARGFDMRLLYTGRRRLDEATERELGVSFVEKKQLVTESDFVSVHLPLSDATRQYLDRATLSCQSPVAYSIPFRPGPMSASAAPRRDPW